MATTTPNIGLTLPAGTENVSRQVINGNWELIDTEIGKRKEIQQTGVNVTIPASSAITGRRIYSLGIGNGKVVVATEVQVPNDKFNEMRNAPYQFVTDTIVDQLTGATWVRISAIKLDEAVTTAGSIEVQIRVYYYDK